MVSGKLLDRAFPLACLFLVLSQGIAPHTLAADQACASSLRERLKGLNFRYPVRFGIYIKDLASGRELSLGGERTWYIASGVKLPIALEVLKQAEEGRLSLDERIELTEGDFVDGAGATNRKKPGSRVSIRFLLEQMLIRSDNTASDVLIRRVGLERIHQSLNEWVPEGFTRITRLSDVRRLAFSGLHPDARRLTGRDFIRLKAIRDERKKREAFAKLAGVSPGALNPVSLKSSYEAYYSKRLNSARLDAYGLLLERFAKGELLGAEGTRTLLEILGRVQTGKKRIRAGLPPEMSFAHKTGTQRERVCDFGIARRAQNPQAGGIVIAACTQRLGLKKAERVLREVGVAIADSCKLVPS